MIDLEIKDDTCLSYYGVVHQSGDLRDAQENFNSLGEGLKLNNNKYYLININQEDFSGTNKILKY
jgi:hypothetical protein